MTECKQGKFEFQDIKGKRVEGRFDGGQLSSDGGLLLIREVMEKQGFFNRLSGCFSDYRSPEAITHTVESMLRQRIYGLVAGYEDLNDHDSIRKDAVAQLLSNQIPEAEEGTLASHSTLNRIELTKATVADTERYKKIACDDNGMQRFLIAEFIRYAKKKRLKRLVLDIDATDIPLHGKQEARFYHGYYGHHCYLPLYIFCEEFPLWAELRPSNIDASLGTEAALGIIVPLLRAALPKVQIIMRADSGFAREGIMHFCEKNKVDFIIGLARNSRLEATLSDAMDQARALYKATKAPARIFKDFLYETNDSWSRKRRVIGKAEYLERGENPRFIVTSLKGAPADLYEKTYCQRGDAENCIKEQFQLFAYRASSSVKRANQLRLWFSTLAYLVIVWFKKIALVQTDFAQAEPATIRTKLIKLAVKVTVSARRVYLSFSSAFPLQNIFASALRATS
jgi:Transposase DDE domain group 1